MPSSTLSSTSKIDNFLEYLKRVEGTNTRGARNEEDFRVQAAMEGKTRAVNGNANVNMDETGKSTRRDLLDTMDAENQSMYSSDEDLPDDEQQEAFEKISSISEVVSRRNVATAPVTSPVMTATTGRRKKRSTDSVVSVSTTYANNQTSFLDGLRQKMQKMKQTLQEKKGHIQDLEQLLNEERTKNIKMIEHHKKQETRLKKQLKKEFESTMDSKLKMVKKLLEEKEKLSEKCKELSQVCKNWTEKYEKDLKNIEEEQAKALKKQKTQIMAQEKLKRQAWMEQTRNEIKEATTQALQPQISRLLLQHKQNMSSLQDTYEQKLRDQRNVMLSQQEDLKSDLRSRFDAELEAALQQEREKIEKQYESHNQHVRQENEHLQKRFTHQLEQEREQSKQLLQEERRLYQENIDRMKQDQEHLKTSHAEEINRLRQLLEDKFETETSTMKERWQLEKEKWKQQIKKEMEEDFAQQKRDYTKKMKQQLDDQIEVIVKRMQQEVKETKDSAQKAINQQTDKAREQFQHEISQLRDEVSQWKERYNELRQRHDQLKTERDEQQQVILDLENQITDYTSNVQKLQLDFKKESKQHQIALAKATQELTDQVQGLNQENARLKKKISSVENELDVAREEHERQMNNLEASKDAEIDRLMGATKQAIAKKDQQIENLEVQLEEVEHRLRQTDLMLARQAQELLEEDDDDD